MRAQFGPFTLDTGTRQLLKEGRDVRLTPKAFDALSLLVEARPNVVDKPTFDARLWPGVHVSDANLSVLISEIRRALSDNPKDPKFIRTSGRVGYAFAGDVLGAGEGAGSAKVPGPNGRGADATTTQCWLSWEGRRVPLGVGEHVIGRNPTCDVWLDVDGVSRVHARIRIDAGYRAVIDDLGSTNGTFVRSVLVSPATELSDGDVIKVGTADVTFHAWTDKPTRRLRGRGSRA